MSNQNTKFKFLTLLTLPLVLVSLASCVTPIKESDRDTTSSYRGFWTTTIGKTPSQVVTPAIRFRCYNLAGVGNLQIAGGRVVARVRGFDLAGFVDSNGKFTAEVKHDNQWKYVFNGQLEAETGLGTGRLFVVREKDGLAGCSSEVELKKESL